MRTCDDEPAGAELQRLYDLRRPAPRVHLLVPLHDRAVFAYHHANSLCALAGIRIGAIGRADLPVRVAEQREVEAVLVCERFVVGGGVEGDAEDDRFLLVVVRFQVAEPATLRGSARRIGLREEPQDDGLAREVRQLHGLAIVIAAHEVGRLVSWSEHGVASGVRVEGVRAGHVPGSPTPPKLTRARVGSTG
jgi:hypothetical protein